MAHPLRSAVAPAVDRLFDATAAVAVDRLFVAAVDRLFRRDDSRRRPRGPGWAREGAPEATTSRSVVALMSPRRSLRQRHFGDDPPFTSQAVPALVAPDFANAEEVRVALEACSSSAHAARDRAAVVGVIGHAPAGTVILAANPDRLGRRPEDRDYIRELARRQGVTILVQGVPEDADDDSEAEEDEIIDEAEEARRAEARGRRAATLRQWRDYVGDRDLVDKACTNALTVATDTAFYTGAAILADRLMTRETEDLQLVGDLLASFCQQHLIRRIVVVARTSGSGASSIRRQLALALTLTQTAAAGNVVVDVAEMESTSVWRGNAITAALDVDRNDGVLVIATSVDRLARTRRGWRNLEQVVGRRRMTAVTLLWPFVYLDRLIEASQHRDCLLSLPPRLANGFAATPSLNGRTTYPLLFATVVLGNGAAPATQLAVDRLADCEGFVAGLVASRHQGSAAVPIPGEVVNAKGTDDRLGAALIDVLRQRHFGEDPPFTSHAVCAPRGGRTSDVWTCRCKTYTALHLLGCRCRCVHCVRLDETACPSVSFRDRHCPPLCRCRCPGHHGERPLDGICALPTCAHIIPAKRGGLICAPCSERRSRGRAQADAEELARRQAVEAAQKAGATEDDARRAGEKAASTATAGEMCEVDGCETLEAKLKRHRGQGPRMCNLHCASPHSAARSSR
jgi:hypothetical protein